MSCRIDWRRLLDAGWWHWVITLPLLAAHAGLGAERTRPCFEIALLLCVAMAAFALWRTGHPGAMAVQVRVAFAALLVLGLAPAAQWFHWVQLAGMTSMVTVGYCPLERLLSLMPCNHAGPLTARLVRTTLFKPPTCGGIFRPGGRGGAGVPQRGPSCADASPCGIAFTLQETDPGGAGRSARLRSRTNAGEAGWHFRHEKEVNDIIRAGK
jgi:hypothetical protein